MKVTPQGFAEITRSVREITREFCGERLISILEGGYDLHGLGECVVAHLNALME
jgi:acetoin utilization deacetylase AcuC-like enzyme